MAQQATVLSKEWLTPEEAMGELGISLRTLQDWAHEKHLRFKSVRHGRALQRLYSAVDVRELKQSGGPPPKEKAEKPPSVGIAAVKPRESSSRGLEAIISQLVTVMKRDDHDIHAKRLEIEEKRLELEMRRWQELELKRWEVEQARYARTKYEADIREKNWLTVEEAVDLAGLTPRRLRILAYSHQITSTGRGQSLRIYRKSLEQFGG
jgi:hypothetical protein